MSDTSAFRVADLPQNTPTPFDLRPGAAELAALAQELGVNSLRKMRFTGQVSALGKRDWKLKGVLGATVIQDCVVTLEPVTTRIDRPVEITYLSAMEMPEEAEAEMPEDDSSEPLGSHIDPHAVMIEALALDIPDYPRKEDAALESANFTEPGREAMTDEDTKPFAGLANLRDQLKKDP